MSRVTDTKKEVGGGVREIIYLCGLAMCWLYTHTHTEREKKRKVEYIDEGGFDGHTRSSPTGGGCL
jgi:hypothetical protein